MRESALYRELNLETINLEAIFKEINDKRESGYFKISYLDSDDYIFYAEGKPVYGVSYDNKGMTALLSYKNYKLKSKNGVLSFFRIPLVYLFVFKYRDLPIPTPYNFVSLGSEFLSPVKLSYVEIDKVLEQIKKLRIDGYIIVLNNRDYKFMLLLQGGSVICAYDGARYKRSGFQKLPVSEEDLIAVFSTEPEIPIFLSSMDTITKERDGIFKSKEELEYISKSLNSKRVSGLLDISLSNGDRVYEFFYQGMPIKRVLHGREKIIEDDIPQIEPNTNNKFQVFKMDLVKPSEIEIDFVESGNTEDNLLIVPESKVKMLRTVFIEEIGPIGALLWNKILRENGYKESEMTMKNFEKLIQILRKEIPDVKHADSFIEKARRLIQ